MSIVKVGDDSKTKKQYIPHQLRSRPFRCITLPAICVVLFIVYWFGLVPIIYHVLTLRCKYSCNWPPNWNYIYWSVVSVIFVILLALTLCLWRFKRDDENESKENKEEQKEHDKLLDQPVKFNNLKNNENYGLSMTNEKKSLSRETIGDDNFNVATSQNSESKIEKTIVTLPIRKSTADTAARDNKEIITNKEGKDNKEIITNKEGKHNKEIITNKEAKDNDEIQEKIIKGNKEVVKNTPTSSMLEEIDEWFPRCSVRRKRDAKKRPSTLIIHSPKYLKEDAEGKRHTMSERPKTVSPLSPREIFFFDLIQSANKQTLDRTQNFLENERKHSSNNYRNLKKPEIKDFILKQRSETEEASSPEYFIANVPQRNSCTTEVFLQVDGGQPEEALTICYIDQDDEVFRN